MEATMTRSQRLESSVNRHLTDFLQPLGFRAAAYPDPSRVGVVSRYFVCDLPPDAKIEFVVWLEAVGASTLHWRIDVTRAGKGLPGGPLTLPLPYANAGPWTHTGEQFHAFASDENFDRAFEFIGTLLITLADAIARVVPELGPAVRAARSLPSWQRAPARNADLWAHRLVQGLSFDPREEPAVVVFVGARLAMLDCNGQRLTFRFDASGIEKGASARVSGWWKTPAGTMAATVLRIGSREWTFRPDGVLASWT